MKRFNDVEFDRKSILHFDDSEVAKYFFELFVLPPPIDVFDHIQKKQRKRKI
jgi:hypothetical protein